MANIRNYISMTDQMTPTLRSIMKSMDSMMKVMKNLDKASNNGKQSKAYQRAEKDIKRASNALIKMKNYTDLTAGAAGRAAGQYNRLQRSVFGVNQSMSTVGRTTGQFLQSLASGVYLAQKLANVMGGVMTSSDNSRSQVARLGLYNTSQYTNEQMYGRVFQTAMSSRSGLSDTADLATKILISGVYQGAGATQAAIDTSGLINRALVAGGGTAEENQRALRQLTQGLASGVLQGDELRSIREQTPYFAGVLAKGLSQIDKKFEGIGIGDLKELGAQGELTADRVVKAMWAMQDEIEADFKQMPKTFGQAMTSMSNIWQYFLWLLSGADGPLGKINDRLWQFVEYLQSPQGMDLLETVALGINFITTAISGAMGAAGDFVVFLQENSAIAQALFISLGAVAVSAGIAAFGAWVAATWPLLLIIAVLAFVAYEFLKVGYTAQEVVGFIAGMVMWVGSVIWDIVLGIVMFIMICLAIIATAAVGTGAAVILTIQLILQIIFIVVEAIITIFWFLWTVIKTVFLLGKGAVQDFVNKSLTDFYNLAQGVLGVMGIIAEAIDSVFGSNLAGTVSGWSGSLEGKYTAFIEANDPTKTMDDIKSMWGEFGSGVTDLFTNDQWNLYDNIGAVWDTSGNMINGIWDMYGSGEDFLANMMVNPDEMFGMGNAWGRGLVDEISGINLGIPSNSVLDAFNPDGVTINGGDLDSVGKIKSDVDISDEDLKLLRDMAARDYLLQLQSITPVAHVTFGDVRETADVGAIVDVIEQMVEEQMATSLVG